jgi:hypothetical protein
LALFGADERNTLGSMNHRMKPLLYIEVAGFVAAAVFAVVWLTQPQGNWEPIVVLCGLTGAASEIARRVLRRRPAGRFESSGARIRHRETLRKEFEREINKCHAENLRQDVVVRHVDRVDSYPDIDENESGISPWFRVALVDTYERGIVVCLRIGGLVECDGGYRFVDYVNGEQPDLNVWLMGDVPYDSIEAVNTEGDQNYCFPHIYCYFDFADQPYERLWFCEKIDQLSGHPYFRHVANYDEVEGNNPMEGTLNFA